MIGAVLQASPRAMYSDAGATTISVTLAPQHEEIIRRAIEAGRYGSPEEALEAALLLLEVSEKVHQLRVDRLRQDIDAG